MIYLYLICKKRIPKKKPTHIAFFAYNIIITLYKYNIYTLIKQNIT